MKKCPVCWEKTNLYTTLECKHIVCNECYNELSNHGHDTCPCCRKPITDISKLTDVGDAIVLSFIIGIFALIFSLVFIMIPNHIVNKIETSCTCCERMGPKGVMGPPGVSFRVVDGPGIIITDEKEKD
jgi:hypothetical protein